MTQASIAELVESWRPRYFEWGDGPQASWRRTSWRTGGRAL